MLQTVLLRNEHSCRFITCNIQFLKPKPVVKGRSDELYSLVSDEYELRFISAHTLRLRLSVTERPSVHCSISAHLCVCVGGGCVYTSACVYVWLWEMTNYSMRSLKETRSWLITSVNFKGEIVWRDAHLSLWCAVELIWPVADGMNLAWDKSREQMNLFDSEYV